LATIEVLDPRGEARLNVAVEAPRARQEVQIIGLLDNSKPNAGHLLRLLAQQLVQSYPSIEVISRQKVSEARPAVEDDMDYLSKNADLVLTGSADCGSCSTWSCHDLIEFERRGTVAVVVTTTVFEPLARTLTKTMGDAVAPIVVIPHPLAGEGPERVEVLARGAFPSLVELLTKMGLRPWAA
jgi:hypothetical protein